MAIDPAIPYPEANDLAKATKGFYACKIQVSHWQLRHYISTPEEDHLYYASGTEVYCLNTRTKKRRLVCSLPFEARCTASGYGWVCVGGEHEGHFAAIKIDGGSFGEGRRRERLTVERIGEEIVNSISIHRITDEEAHLDDIVAVLTNNDKTVRIYSLPGGVETRVKDLPFAINHATISPDGTMMVAVGDYNQAYFFEREIVDAPPQIPKPHNRLTSASVEWRLTNVVTLHVSGNDGPVGYFTTAWSPSGLLVAVGSEGGYITVIDTEMLARPEFEDDEAVVALVPGSRADLPSPHPGAIRSMLFSPEPWDLLIWAEDQGRVCIGDLRTGLRSKQVINLEPNNEEAWEKLEFEDLPAEESSLHLDDLEADILRRYRNAPPDNASAVNFATEYIEAQQLQRRRRQEMANMRALTSGSTRRTPDLDDHTGLTAQEQQVLDALRISRQREESRANGSIPRSVNYTTADMFTGSGSRSSASTAAHESSVPDSFPELSRTHAASPQPSSSHAPDLTTTSTGLPPLHSLRDGIWGSSSRPHARATQENFSRLPRRRQSIVPDENPWRTIEEHMAAAREEWQPSQQSRRERWRNGRGGGLAANFPEGYEALLRRAQRFGAGARETGERTAGLAISADGRVLWAACEKGVFEIGIRVKGRMFEGAVEPR